MSNVTACVVCHWKSMYFQDKRYPEVQSFYVCGHCGTKVSEKNFEKYLKENNDRS